MADTYGTTGNDEIYAGNGNDNVYGGDGNDELYGENGNDKLYGEAGDDQLDGGRGDDLLVGGLGNDELTGGSGNDSFFFNFTVNSSGSWVTQTASFRDGSTPSANADAVAWNNYLNQLAAWRLEMLAQTGQTDENTDLDDTAVLTTSTKKAGTIVLGSVAYDNDYQWQEWVGSSSVTITGEGHDTVLDWTTGNDKLVLKGLSNDSGATNYWGNFLSSDSDVDGKTVISFGTGADAGSITLIGTDMSLADLVAGGHVLWDLPA